MNIGYKRTLIISCLKGLHIAEKCVYPVLFQIRQLSTFQDHILYLLKVMQKEIIELIYFNCQDILLNLMDH